MKKFYVTTAIPYVNAAPHIGNAIDFILADVIKRYYEQKKYSVFFSTGTDEHGQKVAGKAAEANKDPQEYTDGLVEYFKDFAKELDIDYSYWIRTTEAKHIKGAQAIWKKLESYIYKKSYTGWYCTGCEKFVTETEYKANGGTCPDHQRSYEKISEENYFFKLSDFSVQVKEAIAKDQYQILPNSRKNEILSLLDEGLEDISISREAKRLSWGIPVPGDKTQVMYVWFEALMNYITTLDYPNGDNFKAFWPADLHIIGKDITRFHAAIWPAMLIALELPLPKRLLVHGMVNVGGEKMSKSVGNVVDPRQIAETYGSDALRYYFTRHITTTDDGDFTWEKFEAAYNNELGNELGNLVQRVASMINRYQDGVIGDIPKPEHDEAPYHEAMEGLRLDRSIEWAWSMVRGLNQYIEESKPWEIAKSGDQEHLQEVLAYCAGSILQIANLLTPFIPQTGQIITEIFEKGVVKPYHGVLFPKIYNYTEAPER